MPYSVSSRSLAHLLRAFDDLAGEPILHLAKLGLWSLLPLGFWLGFAEGDDKAACF